MSDTNTQKTVTVAPSPEALTPAIPAKKRRTSVKTSIADFFRDWTELLAAVTDHGTDLGILEPQRASLQALLDQGHTLSAQQNALTASSRVTTQQLQGVLRDGKKLASRLRAGVKLQFGFSDAKLVQFGTRPLRRNPRTAVPVTPKPPVPAPE